MVNPFWRKEIQELAEHVRKNDLDALKQVVPETLLNLDQALNYRFIVDGTFIKMMEEIRDGLDIQKKINIIKKELENDTVVKWVKLWLKDQEIDCKKEIEDLKIKKKAAELKKEQKTKQKNRLTKQDASQKADLQDEIDALDTEINEYKENIKRLEDKTKEIIEKIEKKELEKKELEEFWKTYKNIIGTSKSGGTRKKLNKIIEIWNEYKIDELIKRENQGIGEPTTKKEILLDTIFVKTPGKYPGFPTYTICNSQTGETIKNTWGELEVTTDDGQTIKVKGIKISGNKVELENIQVDPMTGVDFPINLRLAIRGRTQEQDTGMNMDHFKNLDITINQPKLKDKDKIIKNINEAGEWETIENAMKARYDNEIFKLEREAIFRALEKDDGPKLKKLTEEQKEGLYQSIRKIYRGTWGGTSMPPTRASKVSEGEVNKYEDFVKRITDDKHESNKPEYIKDANAYRNYILNNLEEQIKKFFEKKFDDVFSKDTDANNFLKAHLTAYLTDIEKQKLDNDTHKDILGDIDDTDRMENRRRHAIDIGGRTYGIGRRDVNYLRFFAGKDSNVEIKDQTVNITTNNRPEDLNNEEPVKYDMNMEISGKQQILVNIKIGKQKEIKLKAGDPASIVKTILQCEAIQHGKVRAHIVYNVMKWFIQSAKKKDLSLTYRDPGTGDMMVIKMDGDNIVLEQQDNQTNYGGTHRRNTTVLFDYKYFENTNTFDSTRGNENRRLRIGIDRLMGHFNFAMNELHYQYRQATERRWLGLRRWATRMTLPTSIFLSPIKKLMNFRTTTKFDFSTTVQSNGKSVSVEFIRNKFTLNMDGLKKPISSRTLGKLLRHREGWVRIFDGMERDICGKIYEELINKMRENSKIARTNFGVKDYITGRTYILDSDGQLGYLSAEQANENQNMIRRGAMSGRDYGVVNNPPAGRTMCDESETREVMKNPFLIGRLIKTMNNRMGIISSTRALLN